MTVFYLGVGCSALTYGLWGYALCHLEAARAAVFDALIPVVGILTAVVVLREAPTIWQLAGGALVAAAVWTAAREPHPVPVGATSHGARAVRAHRRPRIRTQRDGTGKQMRALAIVLVGLLVAAGAALAASPTT